MDSKKIGSLLRELRLKAGETQKQVADAVGITLMAVSQYESGARVPRDEIKIKIASHFNESVENIFFNQKYTKSEF